MNVVRILAAGALAALVVTPAGAYITDPTCSDWNTEGPGWKHEDARTWLMGWLSGYNAVVGYASPASADLPALSEFLNRWCSSHPHDLIPQATEAFSLSLGARAKAKEPPPACTMLDQQAQACAAPGECDTAALGRLARECSPFGRLRSR